MRSWQLPGVDLHGEIARNRLLNGAPPLIFLHGFGGSLHDWQPLWDALTPDYPAIRYDLRGLGQSMAHAAKPFAHADDLLALLNAEEIAQATLIGVSQGGAVATKFALDHPERVHRLILISPLLMGWDWSQQWRDLWRAITTRARSRDVQGAKQLWSRHPLFAPLRRNAIAAERLDASIDAYSGDQWIADHQAPTLPDVDRLPMLSIPTLLMTGEQDMCDFRLIADLIAGCAPNVRRVDLPDCGHMLMLEAPDICISTINTFLAE